MALGLGLIIAIILFKYKPTYVVSLCGEQIGYVSNAAELQNRIQSEIIDMDGENIDFVTLDNMPKYELKLVEKSLTTNEDEIMLALKDDAKVMYKYYAVILNAETITYVDNIEEAEEAVEQIKEEHKDDTIQLDLAVTTNYTENINEKIEKIKNYKLTKLVEKVTSKEIYEIGDGKVRIGLLDFGSKQNIINSLLKRECTVTVFPQNTDAEVILSKKL